MLQKNEKVVITFRTTTDAMAMETQCKARGADGRLIPVPGEITADCGLAWCAEPDREEALRMLMADACIPFQGVYRLMV